MGFYKIPKTGTDFLGKLLRIFSKIKKYKLLIKKSKSGDFIKKLGN